MPTSEALLYEQSILDNIMLEVRRKFSEESISLARVVELEKPSSYQFSLPAIPEIPSGFVWSCMADTEFGARAFGWEAALKVVYQNLSSANTSVNSTRPPAIARLVEKHVGWAAGTNNLDYGCGRYPELMTQYLKERDVHNLPLDPFNLSRDINAHTLEDAQRLDIHTVTLSNVLCVIQEATLRAAILTTCRQYLTDGGKLFITVYEGDGSGIGRETKPGCWQENRKTPTYLREIEIVFGSGAAKRYGKLIVVTKES